MMTRVLDEVKKLQQEGPSADLTNRAKEAARLNYETALKQNSYWLRRLDTVHALGGNPEDILTRGARIDAVTPATLQDTVQALLPARPPHHCHARAGESGAVVAVLKGSECPLCVSVAPGRHIIRA